MHLKRFGKRALKSVMVLPEPKPSGWARLMIRPAIVLLPIVFLTFAYRSDVTKDIRHMHDLGEARVVAVNDKSTMKGFRFKELIVANEKYPQAMFRCPVSVDIAVGANVKLKGSPDFGIFSIAECISIEGGYKNTILFSAAAFATYIFLGYSMLEQSRRRRKSWSG